MSQSYGSPLVQAGRLAWALTGLLVVTALLFLGLAEVSVVVIALVLALFPAALLAPAASSLRRWGVPSAVAAMLLVFGLAGSLALSLAMVAPLMAAQAPALAAATDRGLAHLEELLVEAPLPVDVQGVDDLLERGIDAMSEGELAGRGLDAAVTAVHVATGLALLVVALFFYLRDGQRLWNAVVDLVPSQHRQAAETIGERIWWTLGAYFRGQLVTSRAARPLPHTFARAGGSTPPVRCERTSPSSGTPGQRRRRSGRRRSGSPTPAPRARCQLRRSTPAPTAR